MGKGGTALGRRRNAARTAAGARAKLSVGMGNFGMKAQGSVELAAAKARAHRLARLRMTLERRLESPLAAVDALLAEAADGELHPDLWEQLHAAAVRDGVEASVAEAYERNLAGPRMKRLSSEAQVEIFMHAADFFQGIRGDDATAQAHLETVLRLAPAHLAAFTRRERHLEKQRDGRRLVELYALVAETPPRPVNVLAQQVYQRVLQLDKKEAISDSACALLMALVPAQPRLLDALDKHCCATQRPSLAAELVESALLNDDSREHALARRHRLLALYTGEAATPAKAIGHVELLLADDPNDAVALKVGDRLLALVEVSSRAATALAAARTARRTSGPMSAVKPTA